MPTARIVTRSPERARSLRKTLLDSGYHVEVLSPEEALHGTADLEYDLDEMPEYAGQPAQPEEAQPEEAQPEREFIFAPQWRALKARFGRPEDPAAHRAEPKTIEPSVSYARLEAKVDERPEQKLDEKFVDGPAKGPGLVERLQAMRAPLAEKLSQARQGMEQRHHQLTQQRAERRAAAEEARRVREAELFAKREADRVAAECARAEAALRLQEQKAREAQRLVELQAQMEIRRKEEEAARAAAQERARIEADQLARLEAERIRAEVAAREATPPAESPAAVPVERRHGFGETLGIAVQNFRDWRDTHPSAFFTDTRAYALRQYAPAAVGIALAFFLGWAIAVGGARKTTAANSPENLQPSAPAAVPAAVVAPVASKKPSAAASHKATTAKQKRTVNRFRRQAEEPEVVWKNEDHGGDDVIVIRHYPAKGNLAHSGKKSGGVKTISDLAQD